MRDSTRDQALIALTRDRGQALTRYAAMFTGDTTSAQDLVQDALVKVFTVTRSGRELDALEAYVRRTIVTLYIDGFRRRRKHREVQHLISTDHIAVEAGPGAAEVLDLHAALTALSPQERAVIILRYFDDLTVPDVAAQMGLATGTVKRYLSNAIDKLEQRLGPVAPPPNAGTQSVPVITRHGRRD